MKENSSTLSAEELFAKGLGITYDDFSIMDTFFTDIDRENISLETEIGKGISLKTPIIAAPMDTVTSARLCIAIALQGGIGCIHYNYKKPDGTSDIDRQIREIKIVKRFENGFIEEPVTVSPKHTIKEAIELGRQLRIKGEIINNFPVTEDGKTHGRLVGFLRKEDYSKTEHTEMKVRERMLGLQKLVVAKWPITLEQANQRLWEAHVSFLPIVDKEGILMYLVARKDLDKNEEYPLATKDEKKRLRVLFAVETRQDVAYERLEKGFAAGADGCVVDTSQGFTKYEVEIIKHILKKYPDKLVIGGNISTEEAYRKFDSLGIDAYRCGQGVGSICTTAGAIGIARAGAASVYHCAKQEGNMKTIADGGLRKVGDIKKALTIGAHVVMLGNMLAGTDESPGETKIDSETGLPIKVYRGMGSKEANVGGIRGYSRLPQGVSGYVEYKGSIHKWVPLIRDGLISSFHVLNCKDIEELHKRMYSGEIRFERRTLGSMKEAGVHDIT